MEIIAELKEWFRKILLMNKGHGVNVVACSDNVMLEYLYCKKGVVPPCHDLILRLKAVRVWVEDEFPDLP